MSVYLIDYENVHASGLAGVENCGIEDEIILLYGNDTSTIPMELHIQIANSKGKVQYHKIERTGKNYLDFQLSTIAGFLVGTTRQTEFVIVSRDSGYDAVLDYWNDERLADRVVHFCRRASIAEAEEARDREDKDSRKRRQGKKNGKKNPFSNEKRDSGAKQEPVSETAAADRLPVVSPQQLPNVVEEKKKQVPAEVKPRGGKKGKNQGRKAEEQDAVASAEQSAQEAVQENWEQQPTKQERQEQKSTGQQIQGQETVKQQVEAADPAESEKQEKKQPKKQAKKKNETKGRGKKKQESSQKEEKGAESQADRQENSDVKGSAAEKKQPKIVQPKIQVQEFPDPEQERREPVEITESVKKKIRVAVKGLGLKPTDYTKIYKLCKKSQDKQELYQNLVHSLKQEKGSQVYKAIVGIIF
ncbi:MAG TPA: hypothetical protein IAA55_05480 [Candidatus Pullilachnospira gallistercoris]|uniref:PIN-like domain-containing protein n=1 Tax=Candidatus Pullilachnospira gallistercoris TaxID=2840911 RepID=A0A9D1JAW2_9FIRM|nr:hypothetical protein [Candidatus Pullilachnospira gallistercoris]